MSLRDLLVDAVGQLDDVETTRTPDGAITWSRAERELEAGGGLVRTRREGRYKFHDLDTSPLQEITARWPQTDGRRPE